MEKESRLGKKRKGTFSTYTIFTAILTGGAFSLIGSLIAPETYLDRLILAAVGCFLAHWILSHAFHDLYHYTEKERKEMSTVSTCMLKVLIIVSAVVLLFIAIYLALQAGWMVIVFAVIGAVLCTYAKHLLYHEIMYALAGFFALMGSFYVQTSHFSMDMLTLKALLMSMFAFFTCYGWIHIYRLDHYGWTAKERNKGLTITKLGIPFLILYFLVDKIALSLFI